MAGKIRNYESETITVQYELKRCIHTEECVHRLSAVFDRNSRPWIHPELATADQIADTIIRCPTGALKFRRKDGGAQEAIPVSNVVRMVEDGPHYVRGNLELVYSDGRTERDTRVALCRCGASENKPFCDNRHKEIDFKASGTVVDESKIKAGELDGEAVLRIAPGANGPIHVKGNFEIVDSSDRVVYRGKETWLCRCGGSSNKPFCDSTHRKIGFTAEGV